MDPVDCRDYNLKEKVIVLKAAIIKALNSLDSNTDAYAILDRALNHPSDFEKQSILNNANRVIQKRHGNI